MKICLIAPLFDPWNIGGAEKYVNTLATELSKVHEVIVITTLGPKVRRKDERKNPKVFEINSGNIFPLFSMIRDSASIGIGKKLLWHLLNLWNYSAYRQIKRLLEIEKPDLVNTNAVKGLSISIFSAIKSVGIPHIHTMHDYELISPWSDLFRAGRPISKFNLFDRFHLLFMKKFSQSADVVISPSKFLMDFHARLGYFSHSKKRIIPNGLILDINTTPKENLGSEFLFFGQIAENKGAQVAVKAIKKIRNSKVRLHIVGRGSYLETLKKIAGDDHRIIFHGFINDEKLNSIFRKCSFVILPSLWFENFPLVINEAMNKGLPVIASEIGGIPELVKNGYNGYLFKPGNVDELHLLISSLLTPKKNMSQLSKNAIDSSKQFPIERQIKSILEVYSEAQKK